MLRPILFNNEMVTAILEGRKGATRRVVKFIDGKNPRWTGYLKGGLVLYNGKNEPCNKKPPCQTGDILYVRETWRVGAWDIRNQMIAFDYKDGICGGLVHIHDRELFERLVNQSREDARKAGCEYDCTEFVWKKGKSPCRWRPSIHMPKETARIWLEVTDVKMERLRDINGAEVLKEGINSHVHPKADYFDMNQREMFKNLWNSTIKKSDQRLYGWDANPWVWVIEFERCEKPEGWCA